MSQKQRQLATSTTAAIVAPNQVAFSLHQKLFDGGRTPTVSVSGLATTETMTFYVLVGSAWKPLLNTAGDPVIFTATYCADTFNSAGIYGYIKDETASAVILYVTDAR